MATNPKFRKFSITVQEYDKLLFHSLGYPYQTIPSLPPMNTLTNLLGRPIYAVL